MLGGFLSADKVKNDNGRLKSTLQKKRQVKKPADKLKEEKIILRLIRPWR